MNHKITPKIDVHHTSNIDKVKLKVVTRKYHYLDGSCVDHTIVEQEEILIFPKDIENEAVKVKDFNNEQKDQVEDKLLKSGEYYLLQKKIEA